KPLFNASISGGFNTQATFRKRLSYPGSPTDFLGFDSGKRKMPSSVPRDEPVTTGPNSSLDDADVEQIGRDVNGRMHQNKRTTPIDHGFSVVAGNSWDVGKETKIGVLASL